MLKCVEGNDAHRIIELTRNEIADDGFEIGPLNLGLAAHRAACTEAVYDQVDRLIRAVRKQYSATSPFWAWQYSNGTGTRKEIKPTTVGSFRPLSA